MNLRLYMPPGLYKSVSESMSLPKAREEAEGKLVTLLVADQPQFEGLKKYAILAKIGRHSYQDPDTGQGRENMFANISPNDSSQYSNGLGLTSTRFNHVGNNRYTTQMLIELPPIGKLTIDEFVLAVLDTYQAKALKHTDRDHRLVLYESLKTRR